ncbi:MAG: putative baseplate assembly protein [Vulcanimicrobiaceae bacterium]
MSAATLPTTFRRERRRAEAIAKGLNGIDFVDAGEDRTTLFVDFFLAAPREIHHKHYRVTGGTHPRNLRVVEVHHAGGDDPAGKSRLRIRVDRPGDYSNYRLEVVDLPGFDPLFTSLSFSFGRAPGMVLDCAASPDPAQPAADEPELDYLAKDYESFRQLILDRFALNVPAWTETHVPDIGIALVELLAYVGDQLSYYQDSIATEAYLDTARMRISVRRHARLIDYAIHEGCNARVWIALETSAEKLEPLPASALSFVTADGSAIFEPAGAAPLELRSAYNGISFYTWGDVVVSLPAGTTNATLSDAWVDDGTGGRARTLGALATGDLLFFEEVLGAASGSALDADPTHRHIVRITSVRQDVDPVYDAPIVEIAWGIEDRLPFEVVLTTHAADGSSVADVSVARGNIVLADHGSTLPNAENAGTVPAAGAFRPKLAQPNLTFRQAPNLTGSAAAALAQDPRGATPALTLTSMSADRPPAVWSSVYDLLESGPDDAAFVVEMDDSRFANLRFGDGTLGAPPQPATTFTAAYRVGNGSAGNVGRETIVALLDRSGVSGNAILSVRNPLAASGGTDPEPLAQVKLLAPQAFGTELQRAIDADDYAALAERVPGVYQAAAVLRWSGPTQIVRVAIDPVDAASAGAKLLAAVATRLETCRRIGHDLEVVPATYVPLDIELQVTVLPEYLRGHVASELLDLFSNRVLAGGTLGFFHPENLGFGRTLRINTLIAAAQSVTGVQTARVLRLERLLDEMPGAVAPPRDLALGPLEVAQLDSDPSAPERGVLRLRMAGGR